MIPHSVDTAYVWWTMPNMPAIAGISVDGQSLAILQRKKLIQPGSSTEVLLVKGRELRDGAFCDIDNGLSGEGVTSAVAVKLADWTQANTGRVLKLIADRFEHNDDPPYVLERFLAFVSAWQAPGFVVASFPDGIILDIGSIVGENLRDGYLVSQQGLLRVVPSPLSGRSDSGLFWFPVVDPKILYLDVAGQLVRITVSDDVGAQSIVRSSEDAQGLVEALHAIGIGGSRAMATWAAALCPKQWSSSHADATYAVRGAVRSSSDGVVFFVELTGPDYRDAEFEVQSFGEADLAETTVTFREKDTIDSDRVQTQIIIEATGLALTGCYRLAWAHAGERFAVWIGQAAETDHLGVELVRDFAPVACVDGELFRRVYHPIVSASNSPEKAHLIHKAEFGLSRRPSAEILIFANGDFEALHRTIIGLSLTVSGIPCDINVCVFERALIETLTAQLRSWASLYGLAVRLACFSSRTSEAQAARFSFGPRLPRILLRSGRVPRQANWLASLLDKVEEGQPGILISSDTDPIAGAKTKTFSGVLDQLRPIDDKSDERPAVAAAFVGTNVDISVPSSEKVFGLEAYILALGLCASDSTLAASAPELGFARTEFNKSSSSFHDRLDSISLQTLYETSLVSMPKLVRMRRRAGG
ncbi:hypothetical protein AB4072_13865 [Microvirga sp. 2MCAF38]|uniref:hypothetical protein n=1 Tax=Microvirga sp. 2MCAF38 TaxID=3232989 RepID=UPI003F972BE7